MANKKIAVRIKSPEENGERKDLYPHTSTDVVIDTYSGRTLTDSLNEVMVFSEKQPAFPGTWFDISE